MDRFFIDSWNADTPQITDARQIHHIKRVLRYKPKQEVELFDEEGNEYLAEIQQMTDLFIEFQILEQGDRQRELAVQLILYQGVCKGQKMDLIVQKITELGAASLYPCLFHRCIQGAEKNHTHKLERWGKIAVEAAKQSKRTQIPTVGKFLQGTEVLEQLENNDINFIFYEGTAEHSLRDYLRQHRTKTWKKIGLLVGPEGGFEEAEIEKFMALPNAAVLTLGPRILRTETAAIVATAFVAYELE